MKRWPKFCETIFFRGIPFRSVPFRASELALPRNSECLGMSTFFRGITETVPSLFRGIFSERNSVPNPSHVPTEGEEKDDRKTKDTVYRVTSLLSKVKQVYAEVRSTVYSQLTTA